MSRCQPASLIACLALAAGTSALAAPPQAQVTVDEVVCRYSADCADADAAAPAEAPTRGFSFQTPQKAGISGQPAASAAVTAPTVSRPATRPVFKPKPHPGVSRNDLLVSFENNSFELTAQAKANIAVFAKALQSPQLSARRFEIAGHTNATGPRDYNIELSQRRAEAVVDFLESQGIDQSRLTIHGYGFDKPLSDTTPADGQNRRVEADLLPSQP